MTIQQFAESYRLKLKRDDCGDPCAGGTSGHIYDNGDGRLGILLSYPNRARKWGFTRRLLESKGFILNQDATDEGTLIFDPENKQQAKLAIRTARVRPRRQMSVKQVEALKKARKASPLGL